MRRGFNPYFYKAVFFPHYFGELSKGGLSRFNYHSPLTKDQAKAIVDDPSITLYKTDIWVKPSMCEVFEDTEALQELALEPGIFRCLNKGESKICLLGNRKTPEHTLTESHTKK